MQKLKHQNVIQLYGIVFGEPTMLVIEFCDGGSLLDRLRNTKKPVLLVTKLLSYALQIGMILIMTFLNAYCDVFS